jgi:flagellar biosynthesis protein FlhA
VLPVLLVDQQLEELLGKAIQQTEQGAYLAADPAITEAVLASVKKEAEKMAANNLQPILLCSPILRRHLRRLVEASAPTVMVISHAEVVPTIRLQSVGKVTNHYGS